MSRIQTARRARSLLRLGLAGPSKHGKSFTSLRVATGLVEYLRSAGELPYDPSYPGFGRVVVIDTEHESSLKYAKTSEKDKSAERFDFDVLRLEQPYSPERYIEALRECEDAGYAVVIIDQISHEWEGVGGTLQESARIAEESKSKNTFASWAKTSPRHQAFVEAWNKSNSHVIATMRAKVKHTMTPDKSIKKIGVKPIARATTDYEFDIYGMMCVADAKPAVRFEGTRCRSVSHQTFYEPGEDLGRLIGEWLRFGDTVTRLDQAALDDHYADQIRDLARRLSLTNQKFIEILTPYGVSNVKDLTVDAANRVIKTLKARVKSVPADSEPAPEPQAAAPTKPAPPPAPLPEPAPAPRKLWVYNNEAAFITDDEIQSIIDGGADPDLLPVQEDGAAEWGVASDFGFAVTPGSRPEPEPPAKTEPIPDPDVIDSDEADEKLDYWVFNHGAGFITSGGQTIGAGDTEQVSASIIQEMIDSGYDPTELAVMADGSDTWAPASSFGFPVVASVLPTEAGSEADPRAEAVARLETYRERMGEEFPDQDWIDTASLEEINDYTDGVVKYFEAVDVLPPEPEVLSNEEIGRKLIGQMFGGEAEAEEDEESSDEEELTHQQAKELCESMQKDMGFTKAQWSKLLTAWGASEKRPAFSQLKESSQYMGVLADLREVQAAGEPYNVDEWEFGPPE